MGSQSGASPLVAVVGPTASGKTALGIKIAQKVGGEIICADSRTVYKQMDIGTAKPSQQEQKQVPHHLLDIVEPSQPFSAAEFKRLAQKCIRDIAARGNMPILVGGTGLYIDAVLFNYQFNSKPNEAYRTQLLQMNDEELTTLLHTKNINLSHLNTKNRRHVIRAIERDKDVPKDTTLRSNTLILGLQQDKEVLRDRITARVDQMFKDGFMEEVKALVNMYGWDNEAMSGIGYRLARDYFEGRATENDVKEAFIARDLSLAKRQRTWFKRNLAIQWFEDPEQALKVAVEFANGFDYN